MSADSYRRESAMRIVEIRNGVEFSWRDGHSLTQKEQHTRSHSVNHMRSFHYHHIKDSLIKTTLAIL